MADAKLIADNTSLFTIAIHVPEAANGGAAWGLQLY